MAYLPNKKILFLLFFILLIFVGWFYFSDYKNKQAEYVAYKEKSPLVVAMDQTSQLDKDSDGDGLKDWEELLWKTDSNKADTDGDGTNDNEEITLNRNPLKAGPNDKISDKED
ncbi:MAG: Thrombospondin type 3 repeat superfamily protein [Parcubacteria group bacterium GW2011_GWB1_43_8]|nr:MAG: Thrombospondin type 3 repeat superfamily protein [Parcubacteria group bacterium GW2011_GWB1_43_8]